MDAGWLVFPSYPASFSFPTGASLSVAEKGDGGGVAVDVVGLADGADFAVAEEAGGGQGAEDAGKGADIVVGPGEELSTTAYAGEEEGGKGWGAGAALEGLLQGGVGAGAVAQLPLEGLADARVGSDGDGSGGGVCAEDGADEEISLLVGVDIFGMGEADEEVALGAVFFFVAEGFKGFGKGGVGGLAADGEEEVAICPRDGEGLSDGAAPLGDDAIQRDAAFEADEEGAAGGEGFAVEEDEGFLLWGAVAAAGAEGSEGGDARVGCVPLLKPRLYGEAEGVPQ